MSAATDVLGLKFTPTAVSEHTEADEWFATTGSGLTVTVTVNASPKHPFPLTGTTV